MSTETDQAPEVPRLGFGHHLNMLIQDLPYVGTGFIVENAASLIRSLGAMPSTVILEIPGNPERTTIDLAPLAEIGRNLLAALADRKTS